jgi:hypothetical protein
MTESHEESDIGNERVWERGWEDHERAQAERLAKLPLAKKLEWLEEMQEVIKHMGRAKWEQQRPPPKG